METQSTKQGKVIGNVGILDLRSATEASIAQIQEIGNVGAIIHAPIGKLSFGDEQLLANAQALIDAIVRAKPAASKGTYLKKISLSSTMSPGVRIDTTSVSVTK